MTYLIFSSFFMTAPLEMVAFTTSGIYLMIYLIDIANIDKICDLVGQKLRFLCKLVGCGYILQKNRAEATCCILRIVCIFRIFVEQ